MARTDKAISANMEKSAIRNAEDDVTREKSMRIVRAALSRELITKDDLNGPIVRSKRAIPTDDD